jgi:biotin transporter BioY
MTPFRPETPEQTALRQTANRQVLVVGISTFILGFLAVLFLLGWLIARFVAPEARWWDVLHSSFNAFLISFVAALCLTAGALWLLNQIHYRRGAYPCPYCGRPQKGFAITCNCPDAQAFRAGKDGGSHDNAA